MKTVATNISDEQYTLLLQKVNEIGTSKADYLRRLLQNDLKNETISVTISAKPQASTEGMLSKLKRQFGVTETPAKKHTNHNIKNEWVCPNSSKFDYKGTPCVYHNEFGIYTPNNRKKFYPLKLGVSGLLLLHRFISSKNVFLVEDYRKLTKMLNFRKSVPKFIYNYQKGKFDDFLESLNTYRNIEFSVSYDNRIRMNNIRTDVSVSLARELVSIINYRGYSDKLIYDLCHSCSCSEVNAFIICLNHTDPNLLRVLKKKDELFVENDPSKRRNLIRNGGIL